MALNPEQVEKHEFGSSLRGFDKQEVRSYLGRVSRTIRDLEEKLAASDNAPVAPPQDFSSMSDEDRFGVLGERIAELLRNAHDSAAQIKAAAAAEVAEAKAASDADLEVARAELEQIRADAASTRSGAEADAREIMATANADCESTTAQADADATEVRAAAESEALAIVDARSRELDASKAETEADRETAMAELSEARSQVSTLLEQARAQSEFIRLEADDIIREKIRSNIEAAESRLTILRNTEEISRERIRLAQEELGSALGRLSAEPAPALPEGIDQLVLDEAEVRSIEAGYTTDGAKASDLSDGGVSEPAESGGIDLGESDDSPQASVDIIEIIEESDLERTGGISLIGEAYPVELTDTELTDTELTDTEDPDQGDSADEEPVFGKSVNTGTDEVEVIKQASEANGEDALAKLVREAMQSAVESARSGD